MKNANLLGSARIVLGLLVATACSTSMALGQRHVSSAPGDLNIVGKNGRVIGLCPLKHTSVDANIAGFGARVHVVQTFTNPSETPIEAIYTFPLPHDSAVDRMRIKIGSRVVEGTIKRREEARRINDTAKAAGQTAGLLDQERPNIFTQSVANIMPGGQVQVEISYVQVLKYENSQFEFHFPMVVGPRYLGNAADPEKISPPLTPKGTRTGTSIDVTVHLDAGAPITGLSTLLHKTIVDTDGDSKATITLAKRDEIPNRDFVLRYQTATDRVRSAFVTSYYGKNGGFFNLILLPPKQPRAEDIAPREMIFVMDQSGSQSGFPIEKSKELTFKLLKTMRPNDTFNVYGFNTEVRSLWSKPQPVNQTTLAQAHHFVDWMEANGGTNLLEGLHAALTVPKDPRRLRVVLFNTDGYVGDETNILKEIKRNRDQTRIFTFGIGNGVNRYLIDAMSLEGRGDSEIVTLSESADAAASRFVQRLRSPILTDVKQTVSGIQVNDVLPRNIPDVFSDRPIVIQGRYWNPGQGSMVVSGRVGGRPWSQTLNLTFPAYTGESCVATLWARKKVDDLNDQSFEDQFLRESAQAVDFKSKIVDVALQFGIMSEYTSFVAVEPRIVNVGGKSQTVYVPVEMTNGVSYKGIGDTSSGVSTLQLSPTSVLGGATNTGTVTLSSANAPARFSGGGRGGSGGFSAAPAAAKAINRTRSILQQSRSDDAEASSSQPEPRTMLSIIDSRLRGAKGKTSMMIYLNHFDIKVVAKLKNLGFTIDLTDKKLMLVIATGDAKLLKNLVGMAEIDRVSPVE